MLSFSKATKKQAKARIALIGPSGSGKTYTALRIATALAPNVALIDTERGSASKYADQFAFDALNLDSFAPATYVEAIQAAEQAGYGVLVIDSLSHAWSGVGGALEMVDRISKRSQSNNNFAAWRDVTPEHNRLVDTILRSNLHIIATMRAKTEYVLEANERGKMTPKKVGLAPVQRDGIEYEFDIAGDLDLDHNLIISKTRCAALDGQVIAKPGQAFAETVKAWLTDGAVVTSPHEREGKMKQLRALRTQERELLQKQGVEQKPLDKAEVEVLSDADLDALIRQTESNVMDLRAAGNGGSGGR